MSDHSLAFRWLVWLATLAALALAAASAQARSAPESFADLAEKLLPAVVNISTTQTVSDEATTGDEDLDQFFKDFFDRQRRDNPERRMTSLGSGFVVDPAGYIVTNNHVVAEADEITVYFSDDSKLNATLVGRDEKTDLALLKVEPKGPLPALSWGDSDTLRIGDWVLAIGNPFNVGSTVTAGIVSARNRILEGGGPYDDYIQTDASINRGNSGGPLFNMDGEVVGVNTAIVSPGNGGGSVGIGFAIPSAMAKNVIAQIREFGRPRRGWLGVRIQTVNEELAEGLRLPQAKGALVANVTPGGPAEKAGIRQGDVILKFDGKEVDQMRTLPRMVAETPIDKKVAVLLVRQGQEMTLEVVLGELTEEAEQAALQSGPSTGATPPPKEGKIAALGLTLSELTPPLRQKYSLADDTKGVVVTEVEQDSSAAEKGLHAGDVIVEVDQQEVSNPADVEQRVNDARERGYRVVTFLVFRAGEGDFEWVALRIDRG
jgi:serine protease Do